MLLHLPYAVIPVVYVAVDVSETGQDRRLWVLALPIAVAAGALQLRHSMVVASGQRPANWQATFAALVGLCALPTIAFGINWQSALLMVVASGFLLLPRSAAVTLLVSICVLNVYWLLATLRPASPGQTIYWAVYTAVSIVGFGLAIPAAVAALQVQTTLRRARANLADQVVAAERTRVARDIHDFVGQSLSAVSLKGDLALRLLAAHQPAAAYQEIAELTDIAATAGREVSDVTAHRRATSLHTELDNARTLLNSAGVAVEITALVADLPGPIEEVLAWTVREGTTNILRHSNATMAEITLTTAHGRVTLSLRSDHPRPARTSGSGLRGLDARAAVIGGRIDVSHTADSFTLRVDLPART